MNITQFNLITNKIIIPHCKTNGTCTERVSASIIFSQQLEMEFKTVFFRMQNTDYRKQNQMGNQAEALTTRIERRDS